MQHWIEVPSEPIVFSYDFIRGTLEEDLVIHCVSKEQQFDQQTLTEKWMFEAFLQLTVEMKYSFLGEHLAKICEILVSIDRSQRLFSRSDIDRFVRYLGFPSSLQEALKRIFDHHFPNVKTFVYPYQLALLVYSSLFNSSGELKEEEFNRAYNIMNYLDLCTIFPQYFETAYFYTFLNAIGGKPVVSYEKVERMYATYTPGKLHTDDIKAIFDNMDHMNNLLKKIPVSGERAEREHHKAGIITSFQISSVSDLLIASIQATISAKKPIRQCQCCGKYFIPRHRTDEKYCSYSYDGYGKGGKQCQEVARYEKQQERIRNNLGLRMHNSIRTMLSNKEDGEYGDEYLKFCEESYERRQKIKAGMLTDTEYVDWLAHHYKKGPRLEGFNKEDIEQQLKVISEGEQRAKERLQEKKRQP